MADELISKQHVCEVLAQFAPESYTKLVAKLPAVDAVSVVRCKDCRRLYDYPDDYCCTNHNGLVSITPDSFCSCGEKRGEENAAD